MKLNFFKFLTSTFVAASFLSACGGGGGPVTPAAAVPAVVVPLAVPVVTASNVLTRIWGHHS